MRDVNRGSPPAGVDLGSYQRSNSTWSALASRQTPQAARDYHLLLGRLHSEFSGLCAYCERIVRSKRGQPGPIDHFRPRNPATGSQHLHFGSDLTFDWLNLMYACPGCQDRKGNKWPGTLSPGVEASVDGALTQRAADGGWTYRSFPVRDGYVDPNQTVGIPAQDYFDYDNLHCSIVPSRNLPEDQRSRAFRTIYDIGLEDTLLSQERRIHIEELRQHIDGKGVRRKSQEIARLVDRHRRRRPNDMKSSAYGPAVRFTGLVLFASDEGWFL